MIIKIKRRNLTYFFNLVLIILTLALASLPLAVYAPTTNTTRIGFKVELTITNNNPTINIFNVSSFYVDPIAAGTAQVVIVFNVTDADGAGNINASKAVVNFTLGANSQFYTNASAQATSDQGSCTNSSTATNVVQITCTVNLPYYANASNKWIANISISDINNGVGRNDTVSFTLNTVASLALPITFVNFSNVNVGQANVPSTPLILNNTGNNDFTQINISASALVGVTTPSQTIGATNFGANITNSSVSYATFPATGNITLSNNAGGNAQLLHGSTGAFGPNSDKGNQTVYFWVNVPSSGLGSQLYNGTWNVTVG